MSMRSTWNLGILLLLVGVVCAPAAQAGDWPQILGPQRDGIVTNEQLATDWSGGGPQDLWQRPVGDGFAGPAVVDDRVVIFHRVGNEELLEALDAKTGKSLWKQAFATSFQSGYSSDSGPRCTPVIHDGHVYAYGGGGNLHCVALETGKTLWSRDLFGDFKAPDGYFGAGSSPLPVGDRLLVNVGGDGAGIVALSAETGKTLWQATDERASYSSPVLAKLRDQELAVFITRLNVVAVTPENGKEVFRMPFGARGPTVNAANPLVLDGRLFLSASYGVGATYVDVRAGEPKIVWESDDVMSSQYSTSVPRGDYLYGVDGRADFGPTRLRCFEARTGKVAWTEEDFGMASVILVGDQLLCMKTAGELVLAAASPEGYQQRGRAKLLDGTCRALPALSNGRFFVRNENTLKAVALPTR